MDRTLQTDQIIDHEIRREAAALLKVGREVVPAAENFRRFPQPVLHHGQQQVIDAVEPERRTGHVEDVAQKMEQGLQSVRLIALWADHRRARQTLDKNVPDPEDAAGFVHTLQGSDGMGVLVDQRGENVVGSFGDDFLQRLDVLVKPGQLEVRDDRIHVLRDRGHLNSLGGMEDRAGWHPVHRRQDVAAAQQVLEALHAEPHPPRFRAIDVLALVGLALVVADAPHVFQETEDAVERGVGEYQRVIR